MAAGPNGSGRERPCASAETAPQSETQFRAASLGATSISRVQPRLSTARLSKPVAAKPVIASKAVISATHTPLALNHRFAQVQLAAKLPTLTRHILVQPSEQQAVRSGDTLLWPDRNGGMARYLSAKPVPLSFDVLIERRADANTTVRTSGGTLTLSLAVYPQNPSQTEQAQWMRALGRAKRAWRFTPLGINALEGSLQVPAAHLDGAPTITTNPRLGTVNIVARLNAEGADIWNQALEGGGAPPGTCRLTARFLGSDTQAKVAARGQVVSATLGDLVNRFGKPVLRVLNPEIEVETSLLISGDPVVEHVVTELRTSDGAVRSETFGPEGGQISARFVSNAPLKEKVDWSSQIIFTTASWPPVRLSGTLSLADGWSHTLAPSSWMRQISVTTMLLGPDGSVLPPQAGIDAGNRVSCTIDFTAPFLEAGASLQTAFETSSQETGTILVPRPPGTAQGHAKLTVFALRDGLDQMQVRNLRDDEQWAIIKVHHNARIEIVTNRTPGSETSRDDGTAALAAAMEAIAGG